MVKKENRKIICTAAAFGYGPVAKLLAIAVPLRARGYELVFVGHGTGLELAKHFNFDEIVECRAGQIEEAIRGRLSSWGEVSGVLNVLEPEVGCIARDLSLPHFYVDSLFWMWSEVDARVADADIYFIQRFPGVDEQCSRWRERIHHPKIVGPIVEVGRAQGADFLESSKLIINFAGLESPYALADQGLLYPYVLAPLIGPLLARVAHNYREILITGNRRVMAQLEAGFGCKPANIRFSHLSHEHFLNALSNCSLLVSSPGLTTTYESFLLKVPVRFLPPQNYSQSLMLDYYRKEGLVDFSCHWADFYADYDVKPGMAENLAVQKVMATIERFDGDEESQVQAKHILERVFCEPVDSVLAHKQHEFANSMGRPSAVSVADSISDWFRKSDY